MSRHTLETPRTSCFPRRVLSDAARLSSAVLLLTGCALTPPRPPDASGVTVRKHSGEHRVTLVNTPAGDEVPMSGTVWQGPSGFNNVRQQPYTLIKYTCVPKSFSDKPFEGSFVLTDSLIAAPASTEELSSQDALRMGDLCQIGEHLLDEKLEALLTQ